MTKWHGMVIVLFLWMFASVGVTAAAHSVRQDDLIRGDVGTRNDCPQRSWVTEASAKAKPETGLMVIAVNRQYVVNTSYDDRHNQLSLPLRIIPILWQLPPESSLGRRGLIFADFQDVVTEYLGFISRENPFARIEGPDPRVTHLLTPWIIPGIAGRESVFGAYGNAWHDQHSQGRCIPRVFEGELNRDLPVAVSVPGQWASGHYPLNFNPRPIGSDKRGFSYVSGLFGGIGGFRRRDLRAVQGAKLNNGNVSQSNGGNDQKKIKDGNGVREQELNDAPARALALGLIFVFLLSGSLLLALIMGWWR